MYWTALVVVVGELFSDLHTSEVQMLMYDTWMEGTHHL